MKRIVPFQPSPNMFILPECTIKSKRDQQIKDKMSDLKGKEKRSDPAVLRNKTVNSSKNRGQEYNSKLMPYFILDLSFLCSISKTDKTGEDSL